MLTIIMLFCPGSKPTLRLILLERRGKEEETEMFLMPTTRVFLVASIIMLLTITAKGAAAAVGMKETREMDYDATNFQECSSHCGSEHEGERMEQKLCVELCRLMFDVPEPASSLVMGGD